jgi:hypothetical protein
MEPAQRCIIQRRDQVPGLDVSHSITSPLTPPDTLHPAAFLVLQRKLPSPDNAEPT